MGKSRAPERTLRGHRHRAIENVMLHLAAWVSIYCVAAAGSIVLMGDRTLLSGDLLTVRGMTGLVLNWRFAVAMALALVARLAFTMVNGRLLQMPQFSAGATSVTAFVLAISYVAIIAANVAFLGERLTMQQGLGALLVIAGIGVLSA